jgi:hypothetical protein
MCWHSAVTVRLPAPKWPLVGLSSPAAGERKRQTRAASSVQTEEDTSSHTTASTPSHVSSTGVEASATPQDVTFIGDASHLPTPDTSAMFTQELSLVDITSTLDPSIAADWTVAPLPELPVTTLFPDPTFSAFTYPMAADPYASSSSPSTTVDPITLLAPHPLSADDGDSFPDSYLLPVSELTLLRAFVRIANRLNITATLWDLGARSPYEDPPALGAPAAPTPPELLPPSWRPTPAQRAVAHHPLLDLLPWPVARERILRVFELPEEERPPAARGPLALVGFAYDIEDGAEGMRVSGDDPCDAAGWEIGQKVFERWWFVFDRDIVEQSNRLREARGAARLRIGGSWTGATVTAEI